MPRSANLLGVGFSKSMKTAQTLAGRVDLLDATRKDSGAFYDEVTHLAIRRVSRKVRNRADAEDIAQQTALSIWQHIDRFDPARASMSHWVGLTANAILDRHLAGVYKTRALIADDVDVDKIDVVDPRGRDMAARDEAYERLLDCFKDDVELLDLLFAGYSQAECEEKLGLTRKAVRHRVEKARVRGHLSSVHVNN